MEDILLINITINKDNSSSNTTSSSSNTRKCTLEVSATKFIEKRWKLLFEVHFIKEYTVATVLSQSVGKVKSI
jgi:hypothetical protein